MNDREEGFLQDRLTAQEFTECEESAEILIYTWPGKSAEIAKVAIAS